MDRVRALGRCGSLAAALIFAAAALGYGWWLLKFEEGNRAVERGELEEARRIYEQASIPFERVPFAAQLLRRDFAKLRFNQVRLAYREGDPEAALEILEEAAGRSPAIKDTAEFSFWVGNLIFRRALQTADPADAVELLKQALSEYQRGLVAQPDDWDLKYNFELTKTLLSQRVRGGGKDQEKVRSILEKMRPAEEKFQGQLPVEKRG
jgi:tetratricopeptide (TPR) repeat protein